MYTCFTEFDLSVSTWHFYIAHMRTENGLAVQSRIRHRCSHTRGTGTETSYIYFH